MAIYFTTTKKIPAKVKPERASIKSKYAYQKFNGD